MGKPRRRFPGGSVGSFFVIRPGDGHNAEQAECFLTEEESLQKAQEWANSIGQTVYIAKYVNHATPEEPDA